jgi:hypothetical protein
LVVHSWSERHSYTHWRMFDQRQEGLPRAR